MRQLIIGVVGLMLIASSSANASITYSIVDHAGDQNGWFLSGSITTNGNTGALSTSDVLSWNWSIVNGSTSYSFDSTTGLMTLHDVWATSSSLTLTAPVSNGHSALTFRDSSSASIQWNRGGPPASDYYTAMYSDAYAAAWMTSHPSDLVSSGYTIAEAPVPEPTTLIVWSLLGVLGITIGWWRRRNAV